MLIHVVPRLMLSPYVNFQADIQIEGVQLPELNLALNGSDLAVGRPYSNKRYLVARRDMGRKHIDGFFVHTEHKIRSYSVVAKWLINGTNEITSRNRFDVLDAEYELVTDNKQVWQERCPTQYATKSPVDLMPVCRLKPNPFDLGFVAVQEPIGGHLSVPSVPMHYLTDHPMLADRAPNPKDAFDAKAS